MIKIKTKKVNLLRSKIEDYEKIFDLKYLDLNLIVLNDLQEYF